MKIYLIFIFIISALGVAAQKNVSVSRIYKDNLNRLQLIIHVVKDDGARTYDKEFSVKGWSKSRTDLFERAIIDSLQNIRATSPEQGSADLANYVNKNIQDNGEIMTLIIEAGGNHTQSIYFKKDYKVKGYTQAQKDAIVQKAMESVG